MTLLALLEFDRVIKDGEEEECAQPKPLTSIFQIKHTTDCFHPFSSYFRGMR
jgi:hypothetical protein